MDIINCQNLNKVKYFDLFDYISKIKVSSDVLQHMEDTNIEFDQYMKTLSSYNYDDIVHFWLIQTAEELSSSSKIEKHNVDKHEFLKKNLFFETLDISHERIHQIHDFVMEGNNPYKVYRNTPVRVSYFDKEGQEHIYWHGPEPEDVEKFMDTYIDVYKSNDLSVINSNPFLKSALAELLFIRIHPYGDGNGRTSRVLYSVKFTEAVNKIYGTKLKLCPLNVSTSILMNQLRYVNVLDNIYFDLDHDNNEYINKWFDFMLNMADEQLYYLNSRLSKLENTYRYSISDEKFEQILKRILYDIRELDNESVDEYAQKVLGR